MIDPNIPAKPLDQNAKNMAGERQSQLTKPPGSLGRLEQIALDFAGWLGSEVPELHNVSVRVYAGDHGVSAQGVSAFPAEVTTQMVHNFCSGGAAISVLAEQQGCDFEVWNMGTLLPTPALPKLKNVQIASGTKDFSIESAMTSNELQAAMQAGADSVPESADLFIGGEMGIGNTTSAAALMAALYNLDAEQVVGRGTGLNDVGITRKTAVVAEAVATHSADNPAPLALLQRLGGLEVAALVGAYFSCAQRGTPMLVDGFICSVAAAYAAKLCPTSRDWMMFAHCSAEQAHRRLLEKLSAVPVLDLGMRLGEGSGAAVALSVIKSALALHAGMATFADAQVSEKSKATTQNGNRK